MSATGHWKTQRRTAVLLIPLTLWLLFSVASLSSADYLVVASWLRQPQTMALLTLFVLIGGHHAWLGLQVILEDYLSPPLRSHTMLVTRLALGGVTLLSLYSIYQIVSGGI